ncbi:MAG TPA: class I SAM-dependent methyltransferase, partial [Polyangiaceae bacterium]|jgi:SAM-dependent methyltransferase|nr:class I SAM-dependent methyltransferase [Polyangiaceae bacterium]
MMFGTREAFTYYECGACGCVQIARYPDDIARHYPRDYYAFASGAAGEARHYSRAARWLHHRRARHGLGYFDPIGALVSRAFGELEAHRWLKMAGVRFESSILEVGCGTGFLLSLLWRDGFRNLEGVDPFIPDAARHQPGFTIKSALGEAQRRADFILMSHSLEHMPEPHRVLAELRAISSQRTWLCVRLPLACAAYRRFGGDWGQLDPPRHFYLHTPRSFALLAETHGFRVERTLFDSTALQFWWSEQNLRDVAFNDPRSHAGPHGALFSPSQMAAWEAEASALNAAGEGDQATFFLRPT